TTDVDSAADRLHHHGRDEVRGNRRRRSDPEEDKQDRRHQSPAAHARQYDGEPNQHRRERDRPIDVHVGGPPSGVRLVPGTFAEKDTGGLPESEAPGDLKTLAFTLMEQFVSLDNVTERTGQWALRLASGLDADPAAYVSLISNRNGARLGRGARL